MFQVESFHLFFSKLRVSSIFHSNWKCFSPNWISSFFKSKVSSCIAQIDLFLFCSKLKSHHVLSRIESLLLYLSKIESYHVFSKSYYNVLSFFLNWETIKHVIKTLSRKNRFTTYQWKKKHPCVKILRIVVFSQYCQSFMYSFISCIIPLLPFLPRCGIGCLIDNAYHNNSSRVTWCVIICKC